MKFTENAERIFRRSIDDYHRYDGIDSLLENPFEPESLEWLLYRKNRIDTVQWHLEDIIRDKHIDPAEALKIKRRIDRSNQERTDTVEYIDSLLLDRYKDVEPLPDASLNTETPAWAIDRLSILALKLYHMELETMREDISDAERDGRRRKFEILLRQREDLTEAIEQLLGDIAAGRKRMKLYKQMKMYNDPGFKLAKK